MSAADEPLRWSTHRDLLPFEALMWRADSDPTMRSTVVLVELLDATPDWPRLVAAHEWATRMVPRFRQRIVTPVLGTGWPYWEYAGEPDLHYHLRRIRLPEPTWDGVFTFAEQTAMTPLDPARPLWEATLVEGGPSGAAAYVLKLHHVLSDGMGLAQLLSGLHARTREHSPGKPQPPALAESPAGLFTQVARQARQDAGALLGTSASLARGAASSLRDPVGATRRMIDYAASARRVLSPPPAEPLPLLAHRTGSWRFLRVDVEFDRLRAAGKAAGASVNDAYLAALLGGFRRYAEARGEPLAPDRTMPTTVPVSVRRDSDEPGGNHWAPGRLAAPVGLTDPAARITAVSEAMARIRSEPALESVEVVTPLAARLPTSVLSATAGDSTRGNDLQASNIPGLREEVFLAGARIERIYPYAPLPGCAAMISMLSHGSTCCVAANVDAGSIADTGEFTRCLQAGFSEVMSLG